MHAVLAVLQVFIAVVLIFLILLHSGKDAGHVRRLRRRHRGRAVGGGSLDGAQPGPLDRRCSRVLFVANTIALLKI